MFERIIEIIVYVIAELKEKTNIYDIDFLKLQRLGYSTSEISTALSWIVDRVEFSDKQLNSLEPAKDTSFRVLHNAEKELFTKEAWGEVIQLSTLGLINNEQIENLIERAAMMGIRQLDAQQLKNFVASSFFNVQNNIIPGSRLMLQGNDTIN